jgi:C-terminal processing protease CtpA/Prc
MMPRRLAAWTPQWTLALLLLGGCGKPLPPENADEDFAVLHKTVEAIRERYIGEEAADMERVVVAGIEGMLQSIDPHAALLPAGDTNRNDSGDTAETHLIESEVVEDPPLLAIRVTAFEPALTRQARELESKIREEQPAGILLDLRGCHGHDYKAAAVVADWFLSTDTVIGALIEKQDAPPNVISCKRPELWQGRPVLVMLDGQTEGAGSWLAFALRFHGRARLFGETPRNAGLIQTTVSLSPAWNVRLSTGRAHGPDGQSIEPEGLTPDVAASDPEDEKENIDWMYQQALLVLKEML